MHNQQSLAQFTATGCATRPHAAATCVAGSPSTLPFSHLALLCHQVIDINLMGSSATDAGAQLDSRAAATLRTAPGPVLARPAPPRGATQHVGRAPGPHCVGLLQESREQILPGIALLQPPTQAELHAISIEVLRVLFDARRVAEITRA